jgi:WD40 repeat protein
VVGEYLAAGWAAAEHEEETRRRSTRRLRRLAAGLAVALLLAVGGGVFALDQREDAEANRRAAVSRQLAAEALGVLEDDESTAVRKALDAWQAGQTVEARGALLSAQQARFAGRLGTGPGGWSAAVSPDGTRIAVGGSDGTTQLWDATTFTPIGKPLTYPKRLPVNTVAFSADGRFLATGALMNPGVKVWDAGTGRLLRDLPAYGAAAWIPGTTTLVATWAVDRVQLGVWDAETGERTRAIPAGPTSGYDVAVSPDGRFVAETGHDGDAQVWRLGDGGLAMTAPGALHAAFAPDGTLVTNELTAGNEGRLFHWEVPSGRRIRELTAETAATPPPRPITVTPDGMVITGGIRRTARLLSLTSDVTGSLSTGQAAFGTGAASANGQVVVVTAPDAPTVVYRRVTNTLNTDGSVYDVAFSPDGRRFAAGGTDGKVRVWDTTTRESVISFRPAGMISGLVYAGGGVLGVATLAGTLEIWDEQGRRQASAKLGAEPKDLAVSRDGELLAVSIGPDTGDDPGTVASSVELYDVRERRFRGSIALGEDTAYAVTFSADGATVHTAVTIGDPEEKSVRSELRSWRTTDLGSTGVHALGGQQVLDLAVTPDGQSMAIAGTGRVIDVRTGDGAGSRWRSQTQPSQVDRVAFSPDGGTLAATTIGGPIRLWDARGHEMTAILQGHAATVASLAFSPDSALLASGGTDTQVGVWSLDPAVAVRRLCAIAVPLSRTDGGPVSPLCR